jgi:hypothetical protein
MNSLTPRLLSAATLTLAIATVAHPAQAALVADSPLCSSNNSLTLMNPDAIACSGAWDGNDANQTTDVLAQISADFGSFVGSGTWDYTDKANAGQNTDYFNQVPGSPTGTLLFDNPITGFFAIALKSSTNFSFYLFDGGTAGISALTFSTLGTSTNHLGTAQNLSHASLYRFQGEGNLTPIPEPLTWGSLPLALGFGWLLRRRSSGNFQP